MAQCSQDSHRSKPGRGSRDIWGRPGVCHEDILTLGPLQEVSL